MESRSGTDAFPDANAGEASRGCCELPGVLLEDEVRGALKENLRATRFSSEALFSVVTMTGVSACAASFVFSSAAPLAASLSASELIVSRASLSASESIVASEPYVKVL